MVEYEILKNIPHGKSVIDDFLRRQLLSIKCQIREEYIFTTGGEPTLVLHEALQLFHPVTTIFRAVEVNDNTNADKVIRPADEKKSWQTFIQSKRLAKVPSKIVGNENVAFLPQLSKVCYLIRKKETNRKRLDMGQMIKVIGQNARVGNITTFLT